MANTEILDDILDIARDTANALTKEEANNTALVGEVLPPESSSLVVSNQANDEVMDTAFEFARDKMRDLIVKGRDAVDSAIMLAQSGDSPRAYEVVGGMITAIVQANKELIAIHETKAKKEAIQNKYGTAPRPSEGGGTVMIDKAVFVGRASDLLREIRALAKPKVDSDAEKS